MNPELRLREESAFVDVTDVEWPAPKRPWHRHRSVWGIGGVIAGALLMGFWDRVVLPNGALAQDKPLEIQPYPVLQFGNKNDYTPASMDLPILNTEGSDPLLDPMGDPDQVQEPVAVDEDRRRAPRGTIAGNLRAEDFNAFSPVTVRPVTVDPPSPEGSEPKAAEDKPATPAPKVPSPADNARQQLEAVAKKLGGSVRQESNGTVVAFVPPASVGQLISEAGTQGWLTRSTYAESDAGADRAERDLAAKLEELRKRRSESLALMASDSAPIKQLDSEIANASSELSRRRLERKPLNQTAVRFRFKY